MYASRPGAFWDRLDTQKVFEDILRKGGFNFGSSVDMTALRNATNQGPTALAEFLAKYINRYTLDIKNKEDVMYRFNYTEDEYWKMIRDQDAREGRERFASDAGTFEESGKKYTTSGFDDIVTKGMNEEESTNRAVNINELTDLMAEDFVDDLVN